MDGALRVNSEVKTMQDLFQMLLTKLMAVKDFDPAGLNQLKEDTDESVAIKILARFFITFEESLNVVATSLNNSDFAEVGKGSHKIAGSADLVGFAKFAQRSRKISRDVKNSSQNASSELHYEIQEYLKDGKLMFTQMKSAFPDYIKYV